MTALRYLKSDLLTADLPACQPVQRCQTSADRCWPSGGPLPDVIKVINCLLGLIPAWLIVTYSTLSAVEDIRHSPLAHLSHLWTFSPRGSAVSVTQQSLIHHPFSRPGSHIGGHVHTHSHTPPSTYDNVLTILHML